MSDLSKDFQEARDRYRPLLERALTYFLEDEGAARRVASSTLEQASRQWAALEGEVNTLHLIGLAAADQCKLLLPRSGTWTKSTPTAAQIIRHLEWYDWEQRIEKLRNEIDVKRASARESDSPPLSDDEASAIRRRLGEISGEAEQASARPMNFSPARYTETVESLDRSLQEIIQTLFKSQLGLSEDDDNSAGGIACEIPPPPPMRGPGERREFAEALAAPRNP